MKDYKFTKHVCYRKFLFIADVVKLLFQSHGLLQENLLVPQISPLVLCIYFEYLIKRQQDIL